MRLPSNEEAIIVTLHLQDMSPPMGGGGGGPVKFPPGVVMFPAGVVGGMGGMVVVSTTEQSKKYSFSRQSVIIYFPQRSFLLPFMKEKPRLSFD